MESCWQKSRDLVERLKLEGKEAQIRRVFHKDNSFGNSPFFYVEHIKGIYTQHFVVEVDGMVIDPLLKSPVPIEKYLNIAYKNPKEVKIS